LVVGAFWPVTQSQIWNLFWLLSVLVEKQFTLFFACFCQIFSLLSSTDSTPFYTPKFNCFKCYHRINIWQKYLYFCRVRHTHIKDTLKSSWFLVLLGENNTKYRPLIRSGKWGLNQQVNRNDLNQNNTVVSNHVNSDHVPSFSCHDVSWSNVRQTTSGVYAITVTTSTYSRRCGRL
jgi:hypothetical protein